MTITKTLRTPVNFIVHTLHEVNDGLAHGRFFFMDVAHDEAEIDPCLLAGGEELDPGGARRIDWRRSRAHCTPAGAPREPEKIFSYQSFCWK